MFISGMKLLGAGTATISIAGSGVGLGIVFGSFPFGNSVSFLFVYLSRSGNFNVFLLLFSREPWSSAISIASIVSLCSTDLAQ